MCMQSAPCLHYNPRRRAVECFKRALFSRHSSATSLKNELHKVHPERDTPRHTQTHHTASLFITNTLTLLTRFLGHFAEFHHKRLTIRCHSTEMRLHYAAAAAAAEGDEDDGDDAAVVVDSW